MPGGGDRWRNRSRGQCSSQVLVTLQRPPHADPDTLVSGFPHSPPSGLLPIFSGPLQALRGHQNALVEGYPVSLLHHHPRCCEAQVDSSQSSYEGWKGPGCTPLASLPHRSPGLPLQLPLPPLRPLKMGRPDLLLHGCCPGNGRISLCVAFLPPSLCTPPLSI